jgi:TRAP-type C4-dicarboxylate transport system permease small subunit
MKGISQSLLAVSRGIEHIAPRICLIVGSISICAMVILVISGIIARFVFNSNIIFAIEYTEYLIPVLVLWGATYTLQQNGHINVDLVVTHFPAMVRRWLELIGLFLGLIYIIVLMKYLLKLALYNISIKAIADYPTMTQIGYVQLLLPIGLVFFALQLVIEIVKKFKQIFPGRSREAKS